MAWSRILLSLFFLTTKLLLFRQTVVQRARMIQTWSSARSSFAPIWPRFRAVFASWAWKSSMWASSIPKGPDSLRAGAVVQIRWVLNRHVLMPCRILGVIKRTRLWAVTCTVHMLFGLHTNNGSRTILQQMIWCLPIEFWVQFMKEKLQFNIFVMLHECLLPYHKSTLFVKLYKYTPFVTNCRSF